MVNDKIANLTTFMFTKTNGQNLMSIKQEKPPTFCCRWKGCGKLFYTRPRMIAHTGEHLVNETTCCWKNCQSKGSGLSILELSGNVQPFSETVPCMITKPSIHTDHVIAHCKQQRPYKVTHFPSNLIHIITNQ